ncbi:CocE/NonD family hydrolase [Microbulbifer hainanensis]|uniref:CocE/NonD family hydrolase n=1 Tax=Microbulbifer hainanensis TaxID=2735675 RepID=UPI001865AB01|nr:CocE/NonD family hydrolase [Microbulbifer hainanensis]
MYRNRISIVLCLLAATLLSGFAQAAEDAEKKKADERAAYIRSHYAKYEYQIPMRDGAKLFTSVYIPYDRKDKYPILMQRTPYRVAPYGVGQYKTKLGPSEIFEKEGYIFVFQDVRGKFMSEGKFVNMRPQDAFDKGGKAVDDATDAYDTIDWLVKNVPNNNGRVGMWGTSYPGYYTAVSAIHSHPALKAISPQAPIADWFFDDFHRNGAFVAPMAFLFFDTFDKQRDGLMAAWPEGMKARTPDGYQFFRELGPLSNVNKKYFKGTRPFWNELTEHPNYDDYWKARNVLQHFDNVKPQVLIVGGWYDTEDLYGPLATYRTMSENNDKDNVHLVMGPWYHGQWNRGEGDHMGEAQFGFDTSAWFQQQVLLPFFNKNLKGADAPDPERVTVFETGANRWRSFANWPPKKGDAVTLYLGADANLLKQREAKGGYSDYVSDPNKPVPHSAHISRGWDRPYMAEDQRFSARRPDVLVFDTPPAEQDQTIAGPVDVDLWVSTSQSAADFVVKLVDVFPGKDVNTDEVDAETGNRHELVRWGVMRGRFRNSMSNPEPFEPNKPTRVKFQLLDVLHTIKRGHRLEIQVQSSMFPFLDLNPQKYVDNIFQAKPEDFVRAEHRVYHSEQYPSAIHYQVVGN